MTRYFSSLLSLAFALAAPGWGQQPGAAPQPQQPPATATATLTPALDRLRSALSDLRLDKWKAPGPVREDASSNVGSIRNDLDATLPPLLAAADGAPGSVPRNFAVYRNIDALYEVLLRVTGTAELAAPDEEAEGLQDALSSLDDARRHLGESIETIAAADENRVAELSTRVKTLEAAAPKPEAAAGDASQDEQKSTAKHRRRKPAATSQPPTQPQ